MDMEQWLRVLRKVVVEGRSKRPVMAGEGRLWERCRAPFSGVSGLLKANQPAPPKALSGDPRAIGGVRHGPPEWQAGA